MKAELKQIVIQGKSYSYIQYPEGNERVSSVVGFIIPINEDSRSKMLNTGGFYRDLIMPLFEDDKGEIKRIVILSVTIKGMSTLTGFFFDNESEDMKVSWTKEPNIGQFYSNSIKSKGVEFETINTLEFLANKTTTKFFKILEKGYYNPVSINDTGIVLNGEIIEYGQTVMINNVQTLVEKFPNLKEGNLGKLNVDKIELKINESGPGIMGTIGNGKLINMEGRVITVIEDYYASYAEEGQSFEEFEKEHLMEEMENTAYSINEYITKKPQRKNEIIKEYIQIYDRNRQEELEPVSEMIGLNLLLACIKENLVTKEN